MKNTEIKFEDGDGNLFKVIIVAFPGGNDCICWYPHECLRNIVDRKSRE